MVPAISSVRFHFCWSCSVSILSLSKGESSGGNPFGKSLILRHDFFLLLLFLVFVDLLLFEFFFVISAAFPSVRVKMKKSCYSWKQMSMNCSKITIFSFFVLSCLFQSGERSCDYRWISASLFLVLYFDYQKEWIHYDCLMVWFFFFSSITTKSFNSAPTTGMNVSEMGKRNSRMGVIVFNWGLGEFSIWSKGQFYETESANCLAGMSNAKLSTFFSASCYFLAVIFSASSFLQFALTKIGNFDSCR